MGWRGKSYYTCGNRYFHYLDYEEKYGHPRVSFVTLLLMKDIYLVCEDLCLMSCSMVHTR